MWIELKIGEGVSHTSDSKFRVWDRKEVMGRRKKEMERGKERN